MSEPAAIARAVQELGFLATVLQAGTTGTEPRESPSQTCEVTILSGFLGAGKTTLLRRMLTADHGQRLAVIVNDFGAVNLDAAVIAQDHGDVIELTNGCSCCAMGSDFIAALEQTANVTTPPDHILIEASGLSDPVALATLAAGSPFSGSVGIVTLVDALAADFMESGALGSLFTRQIDAAHLIVLTKTAKIDPAALGGLTERLATRFPGRSIVTDAELEPSLAFRAPALGARPTPGQLKHDLSSVVSRQIEAAQQWTEASLLEHLKQMPRGILRMKGWVPMVDGNIASIQCVGTAFDISVQQYVSDSSGLVLIGLRESEDSWTDWIAGFGGLQTS